MQQNIQLYNTLSRKKEEFVPLVPNQLGLYVCGPTVYGEAHLGHARPAITFDLVFRYFKHLGFKVRYVRNITDVGHLSDDVAETGDDKIAKKAKLEQLEPMEVVHKYTESYHESMRALNVLSPSIEPRATGHIIEQLEMIRDIVNKGYGYEANGNVYFDVLKYNQDHNYGKLSGRKVEDLFENTRQLEGQGEKKNSYDFALWKKAAPDHIMRWPSEFSDGFPGWHMECSAMSMKYLGKKFDIHGGGMDLVFPHHEAEIAQSVSANGHDAAQYWMHNNMITIGGQKMGKSLGNFINLEEFFAGSHELLEKAYSPMTIRFFILQAHYRGTIDFSNEALQAAEKGYQRLMKGLETLDKLSASKEDTTSFDITAHKQKCYDALNDDFNSPILMAHLFEAVKVINSIMDGKLTANQQTIDGLNNLFNTFVVEVLGLKNEEEAVSESDDKAASLIELLGNMRIEAKANKDWATADKIRNDLSNLGVTIKDTKEGFEWEIN